MIIDIPDMNFYNALEFCDKLNQIVPVEGEKYYFDFANVYTCDPFPMLIVSNEIRNKRKELERFECYAKNCNNTYARHMKFYNACGIEKNDDVSVSKGNTRYNCITKLSVQQLKNEGLNDLDIIQEVIDKKSKLMAEILAQGNKGFQSWLSFVIREIMRNVPEHSNSDTIWYCAQYWPSYDLVELAILDEGIGIRKSLSDNIAYHNQIDSDLDAIQLALKPGISGTFRGDSQPITNNEWDNSGYGLYMVSQMCAELDASFIVASGDAAIRIRKEESSIVQECKKTKVHGTAIQIRIKPSHTTDYDKIRRIILQRGEMQAKGMQGSIHVASKSSRGYDIY